MSVTTVLSRTMDSLEDPSQYISASISSLSSQKAPTSWIAKTYREATQLYLTRRLAEALDAIEPVILPDQKTPDDLLAPVSRSSRGTRVKIWSFYITLIDAIIALGSADGRTACGVTRWKSIVASVKEGTIWEQVVINGYRGFEGQVDGEVVANLSTLLLSHMSNQRMNQMKLETYLSSNLNPTFDVTAHMETSVEGRPSARRADSTAGTSTPRDLNTRLKLLELYTLHVLPRNDEWDYAENFIKMSEVLDEERRETFLATLYALKEENKLESVKRTELEKRRRREEQEEGERRAEMIRTTEEARRKEMLTAKGETWHNVDYNPEEAMRSRQNNKIKRQQGPSSNMVKRFRSFLSSLQTSLFFTALSIRKNPAAILSYLLFMIAFLTACLRRDIRDRLKVWLQIVMTKWRDTIAMAMKISYI